MAPADAPWQPSRPTCPCPQGRLAFTIDVQIPWRCCSSSEDSSPMPVQFSCPECKSVLRSSKPLAPGKMIRCPKCDLVFAPEPVELEDDIEEEPAPRRRKPVPADDYDDDDERDEDRPRRRKAVPADDYEDDDYDDDEDRPRRKKKKFRKKRASRSRS